MNFRSKLLQVFKESYKKNHLLIFTTVLKFFFLVSLSYILLNQQLKNKI